MALHWILELGATLITSFNGATGDIGFDLFMQRVHHNIDLRIGLYSKVCFLLPLLVQIYSLFFFFATCQSYSCLKPA